MKKSGLSKDEREILNAIEEGAWPVMKPGQSDLDRFAETARNTFKKDQRMNIRISKTDLDGIKARAAEEGIPYQTLVAAIIHKYVSGRLIPAS